MTRKINIKKSLFATFLLLIFISLPFRLYHFTYPILDSFNFRQAQTATFSLNFYKYGINLFQTQLDIFGIGNHKYLLLEFPLYEAVVAVLYKVFFVSEVWGRLISIFAGYIGALYLYKITEFITKNRQTALFSTLFFLFVPLNLFYHRAFMIDPTIIACLLSGTFYFLKYENTLKKSDYFFSVFLLTLGFLQKGLYGPFWLIPLALYWLKKNSLKAIFRFDFIFALLIPLIVLFFWQSFENRQNLNSGHIFFTTQSFAHRDWNLGTLKDRLSWPLWEFRLRQVLNGTLLKPGLIMFAIGLVVSFKSDKYFFLRGFLLSQILYFLILFRVQTQNYYQLVMIPALSIFMAFGLSFCYTLIKNRLLSALFICLFFAFFISKSFINTLPSFYIDRNWYDTFVSLRKILPENSPGVFVTAGYDWNSAYSYFLQKKLFSLTVEDLSPEKISQFQKDGYSFLVLYDENKIITRLNELKLPGFLVFLSEYRIVYSQNNMVVYEI